MLPKRGSQHTFFIDWLEVFAVTTPGSSECNNDIIILALNKCISTSRGVWKVFHTHKGNLIKSMGVKDLVGRGWWGLDIRLDTNFLRYTKLNVSPKKLRS